MKTAFTLLALLFFGCSAPKYTYYFDQTGQPAAAGSADSKDPVLHINRESLLAALEPMVVQQDAEKRAPEPRTPIYVDSPKTGKTAKKERRREFKTVIRQIRNSKQFSSSKLSSTEKTTSPNNNGFAIAGFVLSVVGWFVLWPLVILGIIFSAVGLKSERRGLATAGLIIGIVGIVLILLAAQHGTLA